MVNSYGDCIYLRNLHLSAIVGKDAWQRRSKPQPLTISLKLYSDVATAGQSDDIDLTTSYGQICKDIQTFIDTQKDFDNLRHLNYELVFLAVKKDWGGNALHIISTVPKGLLRSEGGLTFELITGCPPSDLVKYAPAFNCVPEEIWSVKDLKLACIIGVNAHERLKRQIVVVSLKFTLRDSFIEDGGGLAWFEGQWEELVDRVTKVILFKLPSRTGRRLT